MNFQKLNPLKWFERKPKKSDEAEFIPINRRDIQSPVVSLPMGDYHPLVAFNRELDRMFERVFDTFSFAPIHSGSNSRRFFDRFKDGLSHFRRNTVENGSTYHISLDVPGFSESELSIEVQANELTIKGRKQAREEDHGDQFYRFASSYSELRRSLILPDDVDADGIRATLSNGVLKLSIPRRELGGRTVKRISIQ